MCPNLRSSRWPHIRDLSKPSITVVGRCCQASHESAVEPRFCGGNGKISPLPGTYRYEPGDRSVSGPSIAARPTPCRTFEGVGIVSVQGSSRSKPTSAGSWLPASHLESWITALWRTSRRAAAGPRPRTRRHRLAAATCPGDRRPHEAGPDGPRGAGVLTPGKGHGHGRDRWLRRTHPPGRSLSAPPGSRQGRLRRPLGQPLTEPGRRTIRRLSGDRGGRDGLRSRGIAGRALLNSG